MVLAVQPPSHAPKTGHFLPGNRAASTEVRQNTSVRAIMVRLVTEKSPELVARLCKIALSDHRESRQACEYLLNQVAGAPRQLVRLEGEADNPGLLAMQAIAAALLAAAGAQDIVNIPAIDGEARLIDEQASQDS